MVVDGRLDFPGLSIGSPHLLCSEPCALEYTTMKKEDHFWTDLSADRLSQRHCIHCLHLPQYSLTTHSALCVSGVNSGTCGGVRLCSCLEVGERNAVGP